jgi:hypothetical protein
MIQPTTLRLESNRGQQNCTYFNRNPFQLALMLQLQMKLKLAILVLEVHNPH